MCGIAGIISPHDTFVQQHRLQQMADAIKHRGPEGESYWINEEQTVGFAHRRLRILDLSEAAAQPFQYLHYEIIFNGEIYNYIELKEELRKKGYSFSTGCDTETIPAAYDCWGQECLHHFDGMFVFALYDKKNKEVFIARDRFGEKPLYYNTEYTGHEKFKQFTFASEMKAFWAAGLPKQLNNTMLLNFITLGYVQNPAKKTETFYTNISCLPQGHYLTIRPSQGTVQMKRWYELKTQHPELKTEDETLEKFSDLFFTSVERRLRSDVAVGTSLSGGLDSTAIIAAIRRVKQKNQTWSNFGFTAVFPGYKKDEASYSKLAAAHFNIIQHTVTPSAEDCIKNFRQLMYYQEEPIQSSSVVTQFLVYGLAKDHNITVLLDGQGADEILSGYKKYSHWYLQQLLRENFGTFKKEKKMLRQNNFLETWGWKNYPAAFFPHQTARQLKDRTYKQQARASFLNYDFFLHNCRKETLQKPVIRKLDDILHYSTFTFGLSELLRYADRNSMAHSREVRLPFLSHELVEFIFSLRSNYKIKNGFTKWILRKAMENYLPAAINWRKDKIGYEPPQYQWMLQPSLQEMILESRKKLVEYGVLVKEILQQPIMPKAAHDADNYDWRYLSAAMLCK